MKPLSIFGKIRKRDDLKPLADALKKKKKVLGFTSGAFDILHAGHVRFLEKAKSMCDVLMVGVNSDVSVRSYKGPDRPINPERHRLEVVAALESVDYVFPFDERRNLRNIAVVKPDLYIKAGDYEIENLTSKEEVEKWGGKVVLLPVEHDVSTTQILRRVMGNESDGKKKVSEDGKTIEWHGPPPKSGPAVFLDRDGTIIEEMEYLHEKEKMRFFTNSLEGLKKFQDMGYRLVIVTNQPGIGLGYFSKEDFFRVNRAFLKAVSDFGVDIDRIYFCPHSKAEHCSCRKPNQKFIEMATHDLAVDTKRSVFIGDKTSDMETGKRAGMKTILVRTGFGGKDGQYPGKPDAWADDLSEAAKIMLESERKNSKKVKKRKN
jgi:rfaE bifunctional protein nucleotidyltransferase chain/domain